MKFSNKQLTWKPSEKTAHILQFISVVGFVVCLISSIHTWNIKEEKELSVISNLAFFVMFPLFFGAITIVQTRNKGKYKVNCTKVMFEFLPRLAVKVFHLYFFGIWLFMAWVMIANRNGYYSFGISEMIGFSLIPSVFFAICVMAYWSAKNEAKHNKALG